MCSCGNSEDEEVFYQNNLWKQVPEHNINEDINTEMRIGSANNSKDFETSKQKNKPKLKQFVKYKLKTPMTLKNVKFWVELVNQQVSVSIVLT